MADVPLHEQILDTWRIGSRLNLYLLHAIPEAGLDDQPPTKGRSVRKQLAHLHNVRLMWLQAAAPELLEGLHKFEPDDAPGRELLADALRASADAVEALLARGLEAGKIKGFKPHPVAFLGYLLAHEGHHRGQILLALKANQHMVDRKTQYGLWEWGVR
ncbi:MAG TPA: DinB family protein [Longimicrobiaceae bacterium]|nr:DinB family protein [Longimicrobiaceae bacterium]